MKTKEKSFLEGFAVFVCLLVCILIGIIRTVYMLDAFAVSIVPIGMLMWLLLFEKLRFHLNKRLAVPAVCLSLLFIVMLSLEQVVRRLILMDNEWNHLLFKLLYLPVLFISVFFDIQYLLEKHCPVSLAGNEGTSPIIDREKENKDFSLERKFGLYRQTWLILLETVFFVFAYYPGEMNYDFDLRLLSWSEVFWSDYHTLGFQYFIKLCTAFIPKIFMVTLVQAILFVWVHNYAIGFIHRYLRDPEKNSWRYSIFMCVFGLMIFRYVPGLCKDTNYLIAQYAYSIYALKFVLRSENTRGDYIRLGVFGLFAAMFRHGGFAVSMVSMLVLFLYKAWERKGQENRKAFFSNPLLSLLIPVLGTVFLTYILGFGILKAEKNEVYVSYSIPMNLVGAMAYRSDIKGFEIAPEERTMMEEIMPLAKWVRCYSPYDCDPLSREYSSIGKDVLKLKDSRIRANVIKLDWYFLTHHTVDCLLSYFDVTQSIWEIARPFDGLEHIPLSFPDFPEVHYMNKGEFYYMSENLVDYINKVPILRTIYFRGGGALFVLLLLCCSFIINKEKRYLIPIVPVFIYTALLMLSIPGPAVRYIIIYMQYVIFFSLFAQARVLRM
ncbi:MAG: hypothetical protein IJ073_02770 [Lachnospiraceae bacterium]|nr:hypothetical protein [Lachnospiraceae bacterium]